MTIIIIIIIIIRIEIRINNINRTIIIIMNIIDHLEGTIISKSQINITNVIITIQINNTITIIIIMKTITKTNIWDLIKI